MERGREGRKEWKRERQSQGKQARYNEEKGGRECVEGKTETKVGEKKERNVKGMEGGKGGQGCKRERQGTDLEEVRTRRRGRMKKWEEGTTYVEGVTETKVEEKQERKVKGMEGGRREDKRGKAEVKGKSHEERPGRMWKRQEGGSMLKV